METADVKLLSCWASGFAMRAIMALELKGVKYELIEEDLTAKSQLLLDSNPVYKKVPVLLHKGKAIPESLVIVMYVDEEWPEDASCFFPKDPFERAMILFWSDFIDKKIFESAYKAARATSEERDAIVQELYESFLTLESGFRELHAKPFFNGTRIGYADICLAPIVPWLPVFEEIAGVHIPTVEEAPKLHNFFSAIQEHQAAKIAFPDVDKLLDFTKQWRAKNLKESATGFVNKDTDPGNIDINVPRA